MRPKQYGCRLDFRKLVDRGVNVLRIGNPTRVNDKMLSFTYERRFEIIRFIPNYGVSVKN